MLYSKRNRYLYILLVKALAIIKSLKYLYIMKYIRVCKYKPIHNKVLEFSNIKSYTNS